MIIKMAISVKLEAFEGPLDLLLHLIDKNKVDIYDIPIAIIVEQYLEYVKCLPAENMDVKSEFLVMAATLLEIKSRMLLPADVTDEGELVDPREELMYQLLEYKKYKLLSYELKDKQVDGMKSLYKSPTIPSEVMAYKAPIDYDELVSDVSLNKLNQIFQTMIKRQEDKIDPIRSKYGDIKKDEINIEEKMEHVTTLIRSSKVISFKKLLEKQPTRMSIVVTFLVVLELIKLGEILIEQDDIFDDITIKNKNI